MNDETIYKMMIAAYNAVGGNKSGQPLLLGDGSDGYMVTQYQPDGTKRIFRIVVTADTDSNDQYWGNLKKLPPDCAIIDGQIYTIGEEPREGRRGLGMGGRQFTIDFFDGRSVVTHNLWAGDIIPPKWRDKFPDNAKFRSGGKVLLSDGSAVWDGDR